MLLAAEEDVPVGAPAAEAEAEEKKKERERSIAILDTRTCEDENHSAYTAYILDFGDDVIQSLRYSELLLGHEELCKHFVALPAFPEKTVTRLLDDGFVAQRKRQLERYFAALEFRVDIPRDAILRAFVSHLPEKQQSPLSSSSAAAAAAAACEGAERVTEVRTVNFAVTAALLLDDEPDTIVLGNADESLLSRLDVAISSLLFSSSRVRRNPLGGITYYRGGAKTLAVPLSNPVGAMAWDPNRRWLFVAHGGTLEVFNPSPDFSYNASILSTRLCDASITDMQFCAAEDMLLVVSNGGDIIQFSANAQNIAARATYTHARLLSVCYDSRGKRLFVGTSADSVVVFNVFPSAPCLYVHQMAVHDGSITALCYDEEQRLLVAGSADRRIGVWIMGEPGKEREESKFKGFMVAPAAISSLELSNKGECLVSGDADGTIVVWDVGVGLASLAFRGHFARVSALASLSAATTKTKLLTGSGDERAKLWLLP